MEIKDLRPAWQQFKVRTVLTGAHLYDPQGLLELLEPNVHKSPLHRIVGGSVMLVLIFLFCQGG